MILNIIVLSGSCTGCLLYGLIWRENEPWGYVHELARFWTMGPDSVYGNTPSMYDFNHKSPRSFRGLKVHEGINVWFALSSQIWRIQQVGVTYTNPQYTLQG